MSFLAAPHHAHLCSEHFSECDFTNPKENRMEFCFEADTMFWYSFKILPDRLKLIWLYPCGSLGQSVSHERKRPYTNACGKERKNRPLMPVAKRKKDQTTNAGGKRKMAALIRQANSWHQMKETKQMKPPQNPKWLPTCKNKVEKTPPYHNSLTDYCLQQRSGWLQS